MKKIFHKIHVWLSIPFGLIISIICLTGAILVFEDEIMELCYPERYFVEQSNKEALPIDSLVSIVSKSLPDSVSISGVNISSDPERTYKFSLTKPRKAAVFVDQYTGEIKGKAGKTPFFLTVFKLHRWLMDNNNPNGGIFWGKIIVGVSTLLFIPILISGIVIWIPRTYKGLKNRLKVKVGKSWHKFWYDLHLAGGIYAAIILLALALTGLTWSFSWYRTGFYKAFGAEMQQGNQHNGGGQQAQNRGSRQSNQKGEKKGQNAKSEAKFEFALWDQIYNQLKNRESEYEQISISKNTASLSFSSIGNSRAADQYEFNSETNEISRYKPYKDSEKTGKIRGWIQSIHFGDWGGITSKILTFLAALMGGLLPLSGYYLWYKKNFKKKKVQNIKLSNT